MNNYINYLKKKKKKKKKNKNKNKHKYICIKKR